MKTNRLDGRQADLKQTTLPCGRFQMNISTVYSVEITNQGGTGVQFLSGSVGQITDGRCPLVSGVANRFGGALEGLRGLLTNSVHRFFDCVGLSGRSVRSCYAPCPVIRGDGLSETRKSAVASPADAMSSAPVFFNSSLAFFTHSELSQCTDRRMPPSLIRPS
jgi:hypothetical protein